MTAQPVNRIKPPRGLLIAIVILLIVAAVSAPLLQALIPPAELNRAILLLGLPFLTTFVAIILAFIYFIFVLASRLNHRLPRRIYRPIEALIIAGIVIGVVGMFQPISFEGYQFAFPLLLISTLSFIVWSHIVPRGAHHPEDIGPVSIDDDVIVPEHHETKDVF